MKIKIIIPEQEHIVEGINYKDAVNKFFTSDVANLKWQTKVIKERIEKSYVCPTEGCGYETAWTFEDIAEKGEPVCPNCDEDLLQACEICGKPEDDDGRCGCTNEDSK